MSVACNACPFCTTAGAAKAGGATAELANKAASSKATTKAAAAIHFIIEHAIERLRQACGTILTSLSDEANTKQARNAVPFGLHGFPFRRSAERIAPILSPMPAMPPMVVVMVIVHLGHHLFRAVLDRQGGARIDQRQRLRSFGRSGQSQKCAELQDPELSFRSSTFCFSCGITQLLTLAPCGCPDGNCPAATQTQARVTTLLATAAPKHECGARQAVSARGHLFRCDNTKIGADSRRLF
jgi:hypothetical protein